MDMFPQLGVFEEHACGAQHGDNKPAIAIQVSALQEVAFKKPESRPKQQIHTVKFTPLFMQTGRGNRRKAVHRHDLVGNIIIGVMVQTAFQPFDRSIHDDVVVRFASGADAFVLAIEAHFDVGPPFPVGNPPAQKNTLRGNS